MRAYLRLESWFPIQWLKSIGIRIKHCNMQLRKHIFPLLTKPNKPIALAHVVLTLQKPQSQTNKSHVRGQSSNAKFLLLVACC